MINLSSQFMKVKVYDNYREILYFQCRHSIYCYQNHVAYTDMGKANKLNL